MRRGLGNDMIYIYDFIKHDTSLSSISRLPSLPLPLPVYAFFYYKYNNIFNCYYNCMLLLFSAPQAMSTRRVEEVRLRWTQADGAAERSTPCGRPHVVDASSHLLTDI